MSGRWKPGKVEIRMPMQCCWVNTLKRHETLKLKELNWKCELKMMNEDVRKMFLVVYRRLIGYFTVGKTLIITFLGSR